MIQKPGSNGRTFFTPQRIADEQAQQLESPRGRLLVASCRSATYLAEEVVNRYQELLTSAGGEGEVQYLAEVDYQFSDSETCARLEVDVSGFDIFLLQALYDPISGRSVDENYMAFLIAARTFREWGANRITGVLPYLAYGRQDKPTKFKREPTTASLMADLSAVAGIERVVTWHPHQSHIHGFYGGMPVDVLESVVLFADEFRHLQDREDVIVVAPDAGASKFVTHISRMLNLKSAIASKERPHPEEVVLSEVIGDFSDKRVAIVLDDMISSGGTVYELVRKLLEEKGIEEIYLGVSHNLCVDEAQERLLDLYHNYHLKQVIVTNSIPQTEKFQELPFVSVRCLSDQLSRVINRIHCNRSVTDLFLNAKQRSA